MSGIKNSFLRFQFFGFKQNTFGWLCSDWGKTNGIGNKIRI